MRVNYNSTATPRFQVLTSEQVEEILSASYEILERVGVKIHDEQAVELLCAAGAVSADGLLVKIPSSLVKSALQSAPSRIVLRGRDKSPVVLEKDRIHFGTGSDCPVFVDPDSGKRRTTVFNDVVNAARVADALTHIDFFMSLGLVSNAPSRSYDRHQLLAMLMGTTKPLVITAVDAKGLSDQHEMACLVAGGRDLFRLDPLFAVYAEPSSPLVHTREAIEKVTIAAEHGIPMIYVPAPSAGGTAPVTLAGVLAEGIADTFAGLVLSQQCKPGAPFIMGGVFTALDLRTMIFSYGAPELLLLDAALSDIAKNVGLPVFSTAGCSDAKVFDQQAALEAAMSILMAAQSGANLIHDVGYLEYGLLGSLDMLVFSDEAIGLAKRMLRGFAVEPRTLAVDVISKVGPGGHFLVDEHTLVHHKEELWRPQLLDRSTYEAWDGSGRATLGERVTARVKRILQTHEVPPLESDLLRDLRSIVARADSGASDS